jgi:hypothetical protein
MKAKDIKVGGRYYARVNGHITVVRVVEQTPYMRGKMPLYYAVSEKTNRRVLLTPRRLQMPAE